MRVAARALLMVFVFAIPWEYSLDFGVPLGNVARIVGVALLLVAIPAILQTGRLRAQGPLQVLALALFFWISATYFWSIDPETTLGRLSGYFQELMIVWLAAELVDSVADLRALLRAWLAGSWVLVGLTVASFLAAVSSAQIRFAAQGQDPNDTARFLSLGLPVAALLIDGETRRWVRVAALAYLPAGAASVLLTGSRGGTLAALAALAGCGVLLWHGHRRLVLGGAFSLPLAAAAVWLLMPKGTLERIATIADQAQGGDLNQRVNIWESGWRAFQQAPLLGHGAGTFVSAAGLAPIDTAHNTILSVLVEGGLIGLAFGFTLVAASLLMAFATRGALRAGLLTLILVLAIASMIGTTGESRMTWLLFAVVGVAHRLTAVQQGAWISDARMNAALAAQVRP